MPLVRERRPTNGAPEARRSGAPLRSWASIAQPRIRRLAAIGAAVALVYAAVACGFDGFGTLAEDVSIPGGDATAADANVSETAAPSSDAATDSAPRPLRCDGGRVTDPLTTLDASTWIVIRDTSNGDHPAVDTSAEGPAVSLVLPGAFASLGAIYLAPARPIRAFDVSFRYSMTCPAAGGCADGLAAVWLEETAAGAGGLQTYTSSATFGIPPAMRGAAVAFDVHLDTITGDPATPNVSILAIDGVRVPGQYDWHEQSQPVAGLVGSHDVTLRLRAGSLEVGFDGVMALKGPATTDFDAGYFGLAASSAAEVGTFVVRSFSGTFYECDDP